MVDLKPVLICHDCKRITVAKDTFKPTYWPRHAWTCGCGNTYTCDECKKKPDCHKVCPNCGCEEAYT